MVDAKYIDLLIDNFFKLKLQYLGPKYYGNRKFPDGFNGEIFNFNVLEEAYNNATDDEVEHVSPYIIKKYKTCEFDYPLTKQYENIHLDATHLSLDTQYDYQLLTMIFKTRL